MERVLAPDGREIDFCLERKPVKNLNLRIRRDGRVFVSANRNVPREEIDRFVREKAERVLAAIGKFAEADRAVPRPKKYVSGETFFIQGRGLRLKVSRAEKDSIASDGVFIRLALKNPADFGARSRIIRHFLDRQCKAVFGEVVDGLYPVVRKYGVERPALKIRTLKTRWGSCLAQKGVVTLNRRLLAAPRCCIEYVILHELCHFIHPNHSPNFYAFLSALMPDWKTRKRLLEQIPT